MGIFGKGKNRGVRRSSYPSGPWIDADGNPAHSPNARFVANDLIAPGKGDKKTTDTTDGNPDPNNWKILKAKEIGKYLVLKMEYPNCTNFEGQKILVFENVTMIDLVNQKLIDPHFFPANTKGYKSPIARFEPTERGWIMAESFVNAYTAVTR